MQLNISEYFYSFQGEGPDRGEPAIFIRTGGCALDCKWCDTAEVWKNGKVAPVNFWREEMNSKLSGVLKAHGQGNILLVLTGGDPMLQQGPLFELVKQLRGISTRCFNVQVESEGVRMPMDAFRSLSRYVNGHGHLRYNLSPKLANSGMELDRRYKPEVIQYHLANTNCVFKVVVSNEQDLKEWIEFYEVPFRIPRRKVYLMPCADNREDLVAQSPEIVRLALKYGYHFSNRDHIAVFDRKTGV